MSDKITVQGVVLSAMPVGEYDRRIVLLTRERGKISAFARGARRLGSPFLAAASPFVFGTFTLYEGRSSYSLDQASITRQFLELTADAGVYYGYYFLEIADYFGREGTDEKTMLNLLYLSFLALAKPSIDNRLVRCIFELRTMVEQGMMPQIWDCASCRKKADAQPGWCFSQNAHGLICPDCRRRFTGNAGQAPDDSGSPAYRTERTSRADTIPISPAALYAMQVMASSPMKKLFGFSVSEAVLRELEKHIHTYIDRNTDRKFKSRQILEAMED